MNSWCKWLTPYYTIPVINNSSTNLVPQSHTTKNRLFTAYINNLYLWSRVDISALPLRSPVPRSGGPPPPASDGGRDPVLCSVYIIIWLSLVSVYNNQRSISLDYPGQDRLPNWLSGAPQPQCFRRLHACTPSYCIRRADSVASSHSAPLRCYIVYILSQDCFGLLAGCQ